MNMSQLVENWHWIPGYFLLYEISDLGNIRGTNEGIIKPETLDNGFKKVCLRKNSQSRFFYLHVLLAMTFIPNPLRCRLVKHKDGNTNNISLDNQPAKPFPASDSLNKKVICLETGEEFSSVIEAAKAYSIPPGIVKWLCDSKTQLLLNTFRYTDE